MLLMIWKIMKLILEARKSSNKQSLQKKEKKKKKKQVEKVNSLLNQKARVKRIQGFEH